MDKSKKKFNVSVYREQKEVLNQMCADATDIWLKRHLKEFSKKLGISEKKFSEMVDVKFIGDNEILDGNLKDTDKKPNILFFPGGNVNAYTQSLGKQGAENIKNYINEGGTYYGICAGVYYIAEKMEWTSKQNGEEVNTFISTEDENPPVGGLKATAKGNANKHNVIAGDDGIGIDKVKHGYCALITANNNKDYAIPYRRGPFIEAEDFADIKDFAVFAEIDPDDSEKIKNAFQGQIAGAKGSYGAGEIVALCVHPEFTPDILSEALSDPNIALEEFYMADGRVFDEVSEYEKEFMHKEMEEFSRETYLTTAFDKLCDFAIAEYGNEIDIEKVKKIQSELGSKTNIKEKKVRPDKPTASELDGELSNMHFGSNPIEHVANNQPANTPTPTPAPQEKPKQKPLDTPKPKDLGL
ncbi:MAG: BPL-N domain-containing protein [Alphaproteobacteria bacterium]|jgi:glutamine amidotransferase-like uncharacterized protein|nr:BPL-N domain-containing protein [Alphaproteobacteria bacterium]